MAGRKHVLFHLDDTRRHRLACDDLQWIVERGSLASARPGRDSGYRGVSFVCTRKEILYRVLEESCVDLTIAASAQLSALPDDFPECRALIDRLGIEGFRSWLAGRVRSRCGRQGTHRRRADHRRGQPRLARQAGRQIRSREDLLRLARRPAS